MKKIREYIEYYLKYFENSILKKKLLNEVNLINAPPILNYIIIINFVIILLIYIENKKKI